MPNEYFGQYLHKRSKTEKKTLPSDFTNQISLGSKFLL